MSIKNLRLAAILLAFISLAIPQNASAQKGEKTFGVKTGFISRNTSALAGLYFQYSFSDHFRLAPDAEVAFRHKDRDAFIFDIDCHFPFSFAQGGKTALYPLAGITYASWNRHQSKEETDADNDVSTRKSSLGMNLGAGFELKASPTLKLALEARYSLVKANSSLQLALSIGYIF